MQCPSGNYHQTSGGNLVIGVTGVSNYGFLQVSRTATVDANGNVSLTRLNGFTFAGGQSFTVIEAPNASYNVSTLNVAVSGYNGAPAFAGSDLNLAGWAKKLTGKISSTVGGIGLSNRLEEMFAGGETKALDNLDRVLERFNNGEFDLILVGRGMLGDPAWSERVRTGEALAPFDKSALTRLA